MKSRVLSPAEKADCLYHVYLDRPHQLTRLVVIRPLLLCRILWCQPRLVGFLLRPTELTKLFRPATWSKLWQRIFHGRRAVAKMFPKG